MTALSIKYVNPAKDGKKYGTIKTTDGASYALPAGMADAFQPGTTVEVPTEQQKWGDNVVHVIKGRPAGSMAQAPGAANLPDAHPNTFRPAPASNGGTHKDVQIACVALMKSFIESGKFGVTDLDLLEAACLTAARSIVSKA